MEELRKKYDEMQKIFGDASLSSIYGGGKENNPDICLVFINPTARNLASKCDWNGIRVPWLATKQIWKFLTKCGLFDDRINTLIQQKPPKDWDEEFAKYVYDEVERNNMYITNLAKCTQSDARYLPDEVYMNYKELFLQELEIINPKVVLLFGNQISSILLDRKITVSTCRQQKFEIKTKNKNFNAYAVYYPVGNGFFNADKAVEDIREILKLEI